METRGKICGAALIFVLMASPALAGSLPQLYDASCTLYDAAQAEYVACRDFPETCVGELGAYARNGGATSKLAKMCNFRVLDMIDHCGTFDYAAAHTDVVNAESAMENWVGQTVGYVRNEQLPGSYVDAYFGLGVVAADVTIPPTATAAKEAMWAIADEAGVQDPIAATALSILADLKNRLDQPHVCDE